LDGIGERSRALQAPGQSYRIAECWYNSQTFTLDINLPGGPQQVALYALDWDNEGRSETITVLDASNPSTVLDSRSIPNNTPGTPTYTNTTSANFTGGTYLVWNISGHVIINITANKYPNGVLSGVFFDAPANQTPTAPSGLPTPSLAVGGAALPTGVGFTDNHNGTGTLSGNPSTNAGSPYKITFTASNGVSPSDTQNFTLTVNPQGVSTGPSATFVTSDTTTQGTWKGKYGADGYDVDDLAAVLSGTFSYGSFAWETEGDWLWNPDTSDPRALETDKAAQLLDPAGLRIAAAWFHVGTFSLDLNFTDTNVHQVALYALDWDNQGRNETITVLDASNPSTVLDSRTIPNNSPGSPTYTNTTSLNFYNGTYLVWNISGHVLINITENKYPNGVISGIFFGGAGPLNP
jgi:hypothetical protein